MLMNAMFAFMLTLTVLPVSQPAPAWCAPAAPQNHILVAADKGYGENKPVKTQDDARDAVAHYLLEEKLDTQRKPGAIVEKDLYFEVEILDMKDKPVDRVIVDKRTGRIRSIL